MHLNNSFIFLGLMIMLQDTKKAVLAMIERLQEVFHEFLAENDWMDYQTKKTALEKSKQMLSLIGYPEFIYNDAELDKFYSEVGIFQFSLFLQKYVRKLIYRFSLTH